VKLFIGKLDIRGEIYQCFTASFGANKFTPNLKVYSIVYNLKVEHTFYLCLHVKLDVILFVRLNGAKE
jgi:hypothetical protein